MYVIDKKRDLIKDQLVKKCSCTGVCPICMKKMQFVDKLARANIPVNYWFLKLKDFTGPKNVLESTQKYVKEIEENYANGKGLCYVGQYGTGKTYSICGILKHVLAKGRSAYYTSLNDMIHYMSDFSTQSEFCDLVSKVDFLAIDEVDSRHFSDTEQAQQFFGSNFERVIRYRSQNGLPILVASNNSSLEEVFTGQHRRVIDSLLANVAEVVPSLGKDHRRK